MRAPVHVTALMASMGLVVKVSYNHQYYDYVHTYESCPLFPLLYLTHVSIPCLL